MRNSSYLSVTDGTQGSDTSVPKREEAYAGI